MSETTLIFPAAPRWRLWLAGAGLAVLLAAAWLLHNPKGAPDVTFVNLNGEKITSQSLRGHVVVVNFWATSCETCIKEMPEMIATYNKYQPAGLRFVAVAMSYDPPNYVLNFSQTRHLPFPVALDVNGHLALAFDKVALTPTTIVIGKDGTILKRYVGAPDFAQFHALLEKAMRA